MSIIDTAVTFLDRLPRPDRYFLYITSTIALASGTGYFVYTWVKGHFKRKDLQRRRNTVELRKPPELWNTAIFFPDYFTTEPNSKTAQLIWYFHEAKISIQICIYNSSLRELEQVILEKHREGLLVQLVTGHEGTAEAFRKEGVKVGYYKLPKDFLMHNKFVIFDGEAVMTGSLNWTLDGILANRENVVISTDPRHVKKYVQEFYKLMKICDEADTEAEDANRAKAEINLKRFSI